MAVKIGHASRDENLGAHGGLAGDQDGKEVCTRTWYNKPWTSVIRPKNETHAKKIAKAMEQACANNCIGYDQYQRTTLYTQAQVNNWDISKITTKCETDCSALVAVCVNAAGIPVSKDMYTGNELQALKNTGEFIVYTSKEYVTSDEKLKIGDILLGVGHTAIVLSDGAKVQQSSSPSAPRTYLQKGDKGDAVKEMQKMLIACGYDCGSAGADGDFGAGTEKALKEFQSDARLESDGLYGTASKKALTDYYNAVLKEQAINKNNVSRGQNWLNENHASTVKKCCGGKLLEVDGIYGAKTHLAVLGVWKQYVNKKYGCTFTIGNANFGDSCKKIAQKVILEKGDKGDLVYLAQILLSADGYYTGEFDGIFGAGMKKAVIALQSAKKLEKDGIIGAETYYALFN